MRISRSPGLVAGVLLVLCIAGCGYSLRYTPTESPISGVEQLNVLEVEQVTLGSEVTQQVSDVELAEIREAFVKDFSKHKLMPEVVDTTSAPHGVMVLRTSVAAWNPGSGAARFFIGFGVGNAKLTLHLKLVDKEKQLVMGETDASFIYSGGMFGGGCNVGNMGKRMAQLVRKFVNKRGQ